MLYFKALLQGLDELPPADPRLRAELDARAAREGWPALHAELARHDPVTAARLEPADAQRVQRALEVWLLTGEPLSALHGRKRSPLPPYRFRSLALLPSDRAVLHARIAQRFDAMLAAGLVDEVAALRQRYPDLQRELPAMRCVGYRQAWERLEGEVDDATMRMRGIAATRQLAKRQLTWLRGLGAERELDCLRPDLLEAGSGSRWTCCGRPEQSGADAGVDAAVAQHHGDRIARLYLGDRTQQLAIGVIAQAVAARQHLPRVEQRQGLPQAGQSLLAQILMMPPGLLDARRAPVRRCGAVAVARAGRAAGLRQGVELRAAPGKAVPGAPAAAPGASSRHCRASGACARHAPGAGPGAPIGPCSGPDGAVPSVPGAGPSAPGSGAARCAAGRTVRLRRSAWRRPHPRQSRRW